MKDTEHDHKRKNSHPVCILLLSMDADGTLGGRRLGTTVFFCPRDHFILSRGIPHYNYVSVSPLRFNFINTYRVPTMQQALGNWKGLQRGTTSCPCSQEAGCGMKTDIGLRKAH